MENQQSKFEGYAIVEIMGHQKMAGYVTTEAFGNVVMFKIHQESAPPEEKILDSSRYLGGEWHPAGTKLRATRQEAVSYIGAGSVYRMTPCTREDVFRSQPTIFEVLERPAAIAQIEAPDDFNDDDLMDATEERS